MVLTRQPGDFVMTFQFLMDDWPVLRTFLDLFDRYALKRHTVNYTTRYIVNVSRSQVDRPGVKQKHTFRRTNLFLEKRRLSFKEAIYVSPRKNFDSVRWDKRYHLKLVEKGPDSEFLKHYRVFSKSGRAPDLSRKLQNTLLQHIASLNDRSRFCLQGGIVLGFSKAGWTMTPSNEVYAMKDMNLLIDVMEAVSDALA